MTSTPLAPVVAFLRPRGALGVLEGAPLIFSANPDGVIVSPLAPDLLERLARSGPGVSLYLGSGDVCPAAEGWAARVLALAKGYSLTASPYFLHTHDGVVVLLGYDGGEMADLGVWMHPEIRGPAERLAAVLTYEMERAK